MKKLIVFSFICLPMAIGVLSWEGGLALAQPAPTVEKNTDLRKDAMQERAERVQQRRKARISHADRQAAADRAKAKATGAKTAPQKPGKGVAP